LGKSHLPGPKISKLRSRTFPQPRVKLIRQWVSDPLSGRRKLRLLVQALLLSFKFSWLFSMFHIALKMILCVMATAEVSMASNKPKSCIAIPYGFGKLLLALIFQLPADIRPYLYGRLDAGMTNQCPVTLFLLVQFSCSPFWRKKKLKMYSWF
jgi:hypothetical protein